MPCSIDRSAASLLRLLPPETAHNLALRALACYPRWATAPRFSPTLRTRVLGIDFTTPVGLAAGFDKNAQAVTAFAQLGWGFAEIGGVTPHPQPGNPRPRLFRLPNHTIVNRMGFNSDGLATVRRRLANRPMTIPLFANLGANRNTTNPTEDWELLMRGLVGTVDAFTLNISSPNTASLRTLRHPEQLDRQLTHVVALRDELARAGNSSPTPLLVKLSPDHADSEYQELAEVCLRHGIDGITATNSSAQLCAQLSTSHPGLNGGVSGRPLRERALHVLRILNTTVRGALPLIGVGGIASASDAYARIRAGASLLQIYSAMIWAGPRLGMHIAHELAELLARDGYSSIADAVGTESS